MLLNIIFNFWNLFCLCVMVPGEKNTAYQVFKKDNMVGGDPCGEWWKLSLTLYTSS